jgi:hypothetical protein
MAASGRSPLAILRTLAPYLIAALALGWVLHKTDLHAMGKAFERAPLALFVGVSSLFLVINWSADVLAMWQVFKWFKSPVPYRDLFIVRGSTYLLAMINYHIGQAAITWYLYRARRVPFWRASGWILFIIGINVGTLFLLASAGASDAGGELIMLRKVPWVCASGVVSYGALLLRKPKFLAGRPLFSPLFEMGIFGHVKGVLVRLPHIFVLLCWHTFCLYCFQIRVTPMQALIYLPAYFAVSALPINVNGLGVSQLVAVAFFATFAPGTHEEQKAAVMAYSLAASGISIVFQLLFGLLCLRSGNQLMGPPAVEVEGAEHGWGSERSERGTHPHAGRGG